MQKRWVQFTWNLEKLPATAPGLDSRYEDGVATPADRELLDAAFDRSYSMEPAWSTEFKSRLDLVTQIIDEHLESDPARFPVVRHGNRIIAAAVIQENAENNSNLPLGICVLNEYRCRGIGTFLLHKCLSLLKEKGLKSAQVLTLKGVTAERYLYPKFDGKRVMMPVEVS
jgi:RimJ/RimL family protein N-acetyltransferase